MTNSIPVNTIILLQGHINSGKAATIRKLHRLLMESNYTSLETLENSLNDFSAILEKDNRLIGITSSGSGIISESRLDYFKEKRCRLILAACTTVSGCVESIKEYQGYSAEFVLKTFTANTSQQERANHGDAILLFNKVQSLLQNQEQNVLE